MLAPLLAVGLGITLAWWTWRDRLSSWPARAAALARATGIAILLLLLLDPGLAGRRAGGRPVVLLDNSISMHATGGRAAEAARLAASLGDTTTFGELAPGEPGGHTALADPLAGAVAGGRPVIVVTDGEVADTQAIPADLLAETAVHVLPRPRGADVALTDVRAPLRLAADDTLWLEVEARRVGGAPDTARVEVRDGATVLLHGTLKFGTSDRARLRMMGGLPKGTRGERWLDVVRVGTADAEPGDDLRWWRLIVTPTPGIVVLAESPDWDARFLYRALKDVADAPVRGFAQLEKGAWRRMDDLRRVPVAEVTAAAKAADLLAVRGDVAPWRAMARARLLWPLAEQEGDWYLAAGGASPLAGAFAGVEADSLPPAVAAHPVAGDSGGSWVGAVARLARRGAQVAVIGGREVRDGRTVTIGVDGLYRWGLRGGTSELTWRTLIAEATTWLLASPDVEGARARPITPVTERGRAVRFRWTGLGAPVPVPIRLESTGAPRGDTLRFDGNGEASLALAVGRYRYTLEGGGSGSFGVEPYADELVPGTVTLTDRAATRPASGSRRSLREFLSLFGLAIVGFGTEWMLRRRMGLR